MLSFSFDTGDLTTPRRARAEASEVNKQRKRRKKSFVLTMLQALDFAELEQMTQDTQLAHIAPKQSEEEIDEMFMMDQLESMSVARHTPTAEEPKKKAVSPRPAPAPAPDAIKQQSAEALLASWKSEKAKSPREVSERKEKNLFFKKKIHLQETGGGQSDKKTPRSEVASYQQPRSARVLKMEDDVDVNALFTTTTAAAAAVEASPRAAEKAPEAQSARRTK